MPKVPSYDVARFSNEQLDFRAYAIAIIRAIKAIEAIQKTKQYDLPLSSSLKAITVIKRLFGTVPRFGVKAANRKPAIDEMTIRAKVTCVELDDGLTFEYYIKVIGTTLTFFAAFVEDGEVISVFNEIRNSGLISSSDYRFQVMYYAYMDKDLLPITEDKIIPYLMELYDEHDEVVSVSSDGPRCVLA